MTLDLHSIQGPVLGLIEGTFLPLVISIVQQPRWTNGVRIVIALVASLLAGAVTVYAKGMQDPNSIVLTLFAVVGAAQVTYGRIWRPSGIAPAIEKATSPGGGAS